MRGEVDVPTSEAGCTLPRKAWARMSTKCNASLVQRRSTVWDGVNHSSSLDAASVGIAPSSGASLRSRLREPCFGAPLDVMAEPRNGSGLAGIWLDTVVPPQPT